MVPGGRGNAPVVSAGALPRHPCFLHSACRHYATPRDELVLLEPRAMCTGASEVDVRRAVDDVYRTESRRVFATLVRLLGDFDLAEEAVHDAFAAALEQWPTEGVPANPRAWLVSAGRFKAIDGMRRRARFDASLGELAERIEARGTIGGWSG